MSIQDLDAPTQARVIHEFTSLRRQAQLSSITAPKIERLLADYHQLTEFSHAELLRTQIISAAATVRLVSSKLPSESSVVVCFRLSNAGNLNRYDKFQCRVRFYEQGKPVSFKAKRKDSQGFSTSTYEDTEVTDDVEYDASKRELGNVYFGSEFWAHKLGQTISQLKQANALSERAAKLEVEQAMKDENKAKELKTKLVTTFTDLTALQEISATVRSTGESERVLLICWKFELCVDEKLSGETTWRNIIVDHAPSLVASDAAMSGATPYMTPPVVKEKSLNHETWADDVMDMNDTTAVVAATLQQPFDPTQTYVFPDFSTITMQSLPTTATTEAEGQLSSQFYSDNNFDFSGGHMQLNIEQQVPQAQIDLLDSFQSHVSPIENPGVLYDQNSNWHRMQYPDPYFGQAHNNNTYNVVQTYNQHEDTPFSEAGARQQVPSTMELMPQQHSVFIPDSLQSIFGAPITQQHLSPEETLQQHAAFLDAAAAQHLSPGHIESISEQQQALSQHAEYLEKAVSQHASPAHLEGHNDQHGVIPLAHGFQSDVKIEMCGSEHALQSIEFVSHGPEHVLQSIEFASHGLSM
jgi:hypothetical protein